MSKKLKIVLLIMIVVVVCAGYGVSSYISNLEYETYEGNNMCFKYDDTLEISSREQKIGKNITISSKEKDIEITTFLFEYKHMKKEWFFDSMVEQFENAYGTYKTVKKRIWFSNNILGIKHYREYEIVENDDVSMKFLAQVQKLKGDYVMVSLAYVGGNIEENEKLAKKVMNTIKYSKVEASEELEVSPYPLTVLWLHLFTLDKLNMNIELNIDDHMSDYNEYYENLQADTSLKVQEGYEFLMSRDIAAAKGNIYQVLVPKDMDVTDADKRFISYLENGFSLSMYAREFFEDESLEAFLDDITDFSIEDPAYECINIEKTDVIEKDGMLYQICTGENYDYNGDIVPVAELVAAIPLGGEDVLAFHLKLKHNDFSYRSTKFLEELERYYGVPATQFTVIEEAYK